MAGTGQVHSPRSTQDDEPSLSSSQRDHVDSPCDDPKSRETSTVEAPEYIPAVSVAVTLPPFSSFSNQLDTNPEDAHTRRVLSPNTEPAILQSLRRQLNARDDTIADLQRAQDQLQAQLSRTQARFAAMEIKVQIGEREVVALNDAKLRLARHSEELGAQVEALTRQKHQLEQQVLADGAQWRQIMSMSSRLQLQSAEDARRFNAERQQWTEERGRLEMRLDQLAPIVAGRPRLWQPVSRATQSDWSAADEQTSDEIRSLRRRCQEQEEILVSLVENVTTMERMTRLLGQARAQLGNRS